MFNTRSCGCDAAPEQRKFNQLARKGWSKLERRTLSELLCELAANLVDNEHIGATQSAELKAVFDRHAEVDFDTESRQTMAEMKNLFEAMTGLDLGDDEFESEDALMQHAHRRLQAPMEEQAERARHYNRVLADQLEELKAETQAREASWCMEFKLDPFQRLNPRKLGSVLEREVRELRQSRDDDLALGLPF